MWEMHFQECVFKMVIIDYADYTNFQDYIKNNFLSDYTDYTVIKYD